MDRSIRQEVMTFELYFAVRDVIWRLKLVAFFQTSELLPISDIFSDSNTLSGALLTVFMQGKVAKAIRGLKARNYQ